MRQIIEEAVRLIEKREPFVMATVVRTRGSTPQKAGAKVLIRPDGTMIGTVGGGCVEGEIWHTAKEILSKHGIPQLHNYLLNGDIAMRDGLVCGGTMYVFIDPVWSADHFLAFAQEIAKAYEGGPSVAIATVINVPPPMKNTIGAKLLIREDGSTAGSLGVLELEELTINTARNVAISGNSTWIAGQGGTEIFVEGFTSPPILVLMGGGHVSKAVSRLASTLGFRIYVVDDRPQFANKDRFPDVVDTVVSDFDKALQKIPVHTNTFIIIATRGHKSDDVALAAAVCSKARYIGLLGSKRKSIMIYKHLMERGIPMERIREIRSPIGLDIGAITPEELAISIMAEIVMYRRGGSGKALKMDDEYLNQVVNRNISGTA